MALTPPNLQVLDLARDFKPGHTSFYTYGRFEKSSLAGDLKYILGEQIVGWSAFTSNAELGYVNIIAAPTIVVGTTNMYKYDIVSRGLHTDNTAVPPTKLSADRQLTHFGQQSKVAIVIDAAYFESIKNLIAAATTKFETIAGEELDATTSPITVSLHAKAITAFADYSGTVAGTVKVTTDQNHDMTTGDISSIAGTTNYNGGFVVTVIDATNFYITVAWVADDAAGTVSDGTLHKYHETNYPDLVGMIPAGESYAEDEAATWYGSGKVITGFADNELTPGRTLFADNTGSYTQTASATTAVAGYALTDNTALFYVSYTGLEKSNTTENEAGTDDFKYVTPKGVRENTAADPTLAHLANDENVTGTWEFDIAPTVGGLSVSTESFVSSSISTSFENWLLIDDSSPSVVVGGGSNTSPEGDASGSQQVSVNFTPTTGGAGYIAQDIRVSLSTNDSSDFCGASTIQLKQGASVLRTVANQDNGGSPSFIVTLPIADLKLQKDVEYTIEFLHSWNSIDALEDTTATVQVLAQKYIGLTDFS